MNTTRADSRKRAIAAIHAAKRTLDLDEGSYRDLLERVSSPLGEPRRSAKDMTPSQLAAVLDEFKRLGGLMPSPKTKGKPRNFDSPAMPEMITKIEALLADMKLPGSYADSIANRQLGIERVAWCRTQEQLRSMIAALDVEQEKRALLGHVERTCRRVGMTLEQLAGGGVGSGRGGCGGRIAQGRGRPQVGPPLHPAHGRARRQGSCPPGIRAANGRPGQLDCRERPGLYQRRHP